MPDSAQSESVWVVTAEVAMEPGEIGFINMTVWGESSAEAIERIESYLGKHGWKLLAVERVMEADPAHDHGDEVNAMIDETLSDRNAIRHGTYFKYPPTRATH